MNVLQKDAILYKSADPYYYNEGTEFHTSEYNYGIALTHHLENERHEFDRFIEDSKNSSKKLGTYLYSAVARVGLGLEGQRYGAAFREHFIESVRTEICPSAPCRTTSFFAGQEQSHIHKFQSLVRPGNHILVTVEVIECSAVFMGDMAVLDELEVFQHDYTQARAIVERYWRQEQAQHPCPELIVQGHFRWGNVIN